MGTLSDQQLNIEIKEADLPILATVAVEAMMLIERDEATAKDLEHLICADPALTAKILRLANSPVYAGREQTTTISQAVVRLGLDQLKQVIYIAAISDISDPRDPYQRALWNHAVAVAVTSQWLSDRLKIGKLQECFIAGLLHDIGKLIIYRQAPKEYAAIIDEAAGEGARFYEYERVRIIHCSHQSVGALVGLKWRLGRDLIEVIRFHHDIEHDGQIMLDAQPLVALVSVANLLTHQLGLAAEAPLTLDALDSKPAQIIGLNAETVEQCGEALPALVEEQRGAFV